MEVTVLGKSPSWQDADGAGSAYLVRHDGFTLLLDCGNGAFAKLRAAVDYVDVDAVLITHLHADHFFDVFPYAYALGTGPRQGLVRPPLYLPPGGAECVGTISRCLGSAGIIDRAFLVHEYRPQDHLTLGPLAVRFRAVPHYVPTHAVELRTAAGVRVTFGADCRPNDALVDFARDTDLLFAEATLPAPEEGLRGHLTPREAGEHARAAGARALVLTHFSDELDPAWVRREGAAGYRAEVALAAEGAVYTVRPRA